MVKGLCAQSGTGPSTYEVYSIGRATASLLWGIGTGSPVTRNSSRKADLDAVREDSSIVDCDTDASANAVNQSSLVMRPGQQFGSSEMNRSASSGSDVT